MRLEARKNDLQSARISKGMNQRDLAALVGTSSSYISQIENQVKKPAPRMAKKIASALGVGIYEVFTLIDCDGKHTPQQTRRSDD